MKHYVSVYSSVTEKAIENLCRVFSTKEEADAYKAQLKAAHRLIVIL